MTDMPKGSAFERANRAKQPTVKASGPKGSPLLAASARESLFERLFGSRGETPDPHHVICGPIRKTPGLER